MGYTHYWSIKPFHLHAKQLRIDETTRVMLVLLCSDAHDVPIQLEVNNGGERGLSFVLSGVGRDAHEGFCWPPQPDPSAEPSPLFSDFCKTAQKPYDVLVTACLTIAQAMLGRDVLTLRTDGEAYDWRLGVRLARKVISDDSLPNPFGPVPGEP